MKERPILFNTDMVKAILEGRKTQTRRVVKPMNGEQSKWLSNELLSKSLSCYLCEVNRELGAQFQHPKAGETIGSVKVEKMSPLGWIKCPYGQVGDRLWVRETWASLRLEIDYESGIVDGWEEVEPDVVKRNKEIGYFTIAYKADEHWDDGYNCVEDRGFRFRPSIHMPRWASRITLEITDIRVERVQDIDDESAGKEGISNYNYNGKYCDSGKLIFKQMWNSITKNKAHKWDKNPWVWVIEFKRIGE